MRRAQLILALVVLCFPVFLFAQAQEEVTEEEVVSILEGDRGKAPATEPPSVAFGLSFSPVTAGVSDKAKQGTNGGGQQSEEFYMKLIPLGRALESDALKDFRFALVVHADPRLPGDLEELLALKVAEQVKHILTTYFAIAHDRLVIPYNEPHLPAPEAVSESMAAHSWRVEITLLE